jgi:peptidylprolyl isomerase
MTRTLLTALACALAATPVAAQEKPAEAPTPASIVAAAKPAEWAAIDPADLLVMKLAPGAKGEQRQVIVQLMPPPFSQGWIGNIRALARAHWWDGTSVYRVVDNWVAQWGDADEAKPLPEGLREVPESEYVTPVQSDPAGVRDFVLTPERAGIVINRFIDSYAVTGFVAGWPIGLDDKGGGTAWPVHCYGHVGVARDLSPSTGSGSELYALIGHAPRQLDRNIAVVGRVIEGIEYLSTLPRGKGEAGVYDDPALRVPIISVRLADELPEAERPRFQYLSSESESFAQYLHIRANRNDPFYRVPAGAVDLCNVQVPIRRVPSG